jgi:Ca-activated chloride channel family protein
MALAGPRWGEEMIVTEQRSLTVVVAMDISRSMLAEDTRPNRLGRAIREARRLVQDLDGDLLGLIAFAGSSHILSPLTLDGSNILVQLDALDPDVASEGSTMLAAPLRQGEELLATSSEFSDRVLVVFTDGEPHDTLAGILDHAARLRTRGVRLILVAEGGDRPVRIPVRDFDGKFIQWQQSDGKDIETRRRDDVLEAVADAAQGTIVASAVQDQAGAVREQVTALKRAPTRETRTQRGRARAWIFVLLAAMLLIVQAAMRRTAALI